MDCENCGAPMIVMRAQAYFYCEYCGSFRFPPQSSNGVRVLAEESNLCCPVCSNRLVSASAAGEHILYCTRCRGLLAAQKSFTSIVDNLRARAAGPGERPRPLNREELKRRIACPSCGNVMDTHPYYGPGNIVIDICNQCRIIWLDHGELATIVAAPGPDRGHPRKYTYPT